MGKDIHVSSFDEMSKTAQKLQSYSQSYTEIYTKLLQTASTMGSAWEGADNQAYVEQINGFADDLKRMAEALAQESRNIEQQRANYVARQDDNITQVKKLQN